MQKIIMLANAAGCPDGIHSKEFVAGESYDVPDDLAHNFFLMNVAELHEVKSEKAEMQTPKNKSQNKAPKNKSVLGDE